MQIELKTFNDLSNNELYEILRLRSEIFVVEQNCVYNDLDGLDIDGLHLFAIIDTEIVGYVRILNAGTRFPVASIGRVITHQKYRHQGISTILMTEAIQYLKEEWKVSQIKISAQKYLRQFYESMGFKVVTSEYLEDGIPHFGMLLIFQN